jgi:hypothetical protein
MQNMRRIAMSLLIIGSLVYASTAWEATTSQNVQVTVSSPGSSLLPGDRDASANWRMAGMLSKGGIPNRTTVCATVSPLGNGQDDTGKIQTAISNCPPGEVVMLSAGTFTIAAGSNVLINKGITLRGAGAGSTILKHPSVPSGACVGCSPLIILGPARWGITTGHPMNLSSDAAQGATTITLNCGGNCASIFSPGQFVLLDELTGAVFQTDPTWPTMQIFASPDWRTVYHIHNPACCGDDTGINTSDTFSRVDRPQNEIKEIAANGVNGNNITFTSPVIIPYRTSHTAQLSRFDDFISGNSITFTTYAGIEKLSVLYGDADAIDVANCAYCWAKNIENSVWLGRGIDIMSAFRFELDEFYSHDAYDPQPTSGAYAIGLDWASSEILIQDSISVKTNKVIVARAGGAGSVVAYNYTDMSLIDYAETWQEIGLNASHYIGPHHLLFEGNYGSNADGDFTHGNSTNITFLRNWLRGVRHPFVNSWVCGASCSTGHTVNDYAQGNGPARTVGPQSYHYWYTFIGNVLGAQGLMSGWKYQCDLTNDQCIWAPGWGESNASGVWGTDPQVTSSSFPGHMIRDGNRDWVTSSQHWDDMPATIPNSFYLSSKPAFFGSNTWPWVDPTTGSTPADGLPAKARYDAGTPNCNC